MAEAEHSVPSGLHHFAKGRRADHAEIELPAILERLMGVALHGPLALEQEGQMQPARIRPVIENGQGGFGIFRGEYRLAEADPDPMAGLLRVHLAGNEWWCGENLQPVGQVAARP